MGKLGIITPEFYLDEATHTYHYGGRRIPGISEVLKAFGFIDPTYYTERGRAVGQAVHAGIHYLEEGDLNWASITNADVEGRIRAYLKFKEEKGFVPDRSLMETPLHYPGGLYGCKIDWTGEIDGYPFNLIEGKCGAKSAWHKLQTGGQLRTLPEREQPWRRWALYLRPDATYSLEPHTDPCDPGVFVGLASGFNWKANNYGYR